MQVVRLKCMVAMTHKSRFTTFERGELCKAWHSRELWDSHRHCSDTRQYLPWINTPILHAFHFAYRSRCDCIHVRTLSSLFSIEEIDSVSEAIDPIVDILSMKPFLAGVYNGKNYGVIKRHITSGVFRYSCSTYMSTSQCSHIELYKSWAA